MKTIAYQMGWDRADVVTCVDDVEYIVEFNPEVYAREFGKQLFSTKAELRDFQKGMEDFLLYKVKRDESRKLQDLKREEKRLSSIKEQNKKFGLLDIAFFLMAMCIGHKHND